MATQRKPKLYLAGPEVFLPDPVAYADQQRALCAQYGFTPLHPVDNGPTSGEQRIAALQRLYDAVQLYRTTPQRALAALPSEEMRCAMKIYLGNIRYVRECDIVMANCNAFRGALVDDGTAYELGLGNGLGKPTYGYIETALPAVQNVLQRYPCTIQDDGVPRDRDGYLVVDDFGTAINLMLECGMLLGGGRLVEGSFEDCLRAIRGDLDTGRLLLPKEPS
jgi:nucleoside 2-deoxyribosyltransferase